MSTPTDPDALVAAARRAADNAHAPYSGCRVGAAVTFAGASGPPFVGANVENASYGLTLCAERGAIVAGIVAGHRRIERLAISARDSSGELLRGIVPCGACLQVMAEFAGADLEIAIDGGGTLRLADLLPRPFLYGVTEPGQGR